MKTKKFCIRTTMTLLLMVLTTVSAWAQDPVDSGYCGDPDVNSGHNVTWALTGTSPNYTLTISGTGAMVNFHDNNQPWYSYLGNITSVVIGNGLTSIGDAAFSGCSQLTSVTIPASVESIGMEVFYNCAMTTVNFPSDSELKTIGVNAFFACEDLSTITLPNKLKTIGESAFYRCTNLSKVNMLPTTPPTLGANAFTYCNDLEIIYVPPTTETSYKAATNWSDYAGIIKTGYRVTADPVANMTLTGNVGVQYGSTVYAAVGETVSLTMRDPSNPPAGYSSSIDGNYRAGTQILNPDEGVYKVTISGQDVIITCFMLNTYDITYHLNEGSWDGENQPSIYNILCNDIILPTATKAGIPLYGWYDNENLTGDPIYKIPAGSTGDKEFWAKYAKNIANCTATVPDQLLNTDEYNTSYIEYRFGDVPQYIGESVKDGNTVLTRGTDYEFGNVYFYGTSKPSTEVENKVNDHFTVEINGIGDYAGTLEADFYIGVTIAPTEWENLTWSLSKSVLNISLTDPTGENKTMPTVAAYDSYPWHTYQSYITSVVIGNGITNVANYAFGGTQSDNYSTVTTVTLPASVTSIGEYAFAYCGATFNLDNIITQVGASNIGTSAFNQVAKLVGTLYDDADNTARIALFDMAQNADVTLSGRTFKGGKKQTICLPFNPSKLLQLGTVWAFTSIEDNKIVMTQQTGSLSENTPYIFQATNDASDVQFSNVRVRSNNPQTENTTYQFTFKGTYTQKTWEADDPAVTSGHLYGFMMQDNDGQEEGQFVKARRKTILRPFSCYLEYNGDLTDINPVSQSASRRALESLPDVIDIVWQSADGVVTGISQMNTRTGEIIDSNGWYTLGGQRLNGKPSTNGVYINNGKKVIIK